MDYDEIYKQAYEDTLEKIADKGVALRDFGIGAAGGIGATAYAAKKNPNFARDILHAAPELSNPNTKLLGNLASIQASKMSGQAVAKMFK